MDLKTRVQGIVLQPKEEWEKIKEETYPVSQLFSSYVMILAAIPAVAQFIGNWLVGQRIPFYGTYRHGFGSGLLRAVLFYGMTLASVYLLGFIINALADSFASRKDQLSAMKLAVFSQTPGWIAGALYIIPTLGVLVPLLSLYGIYLMYLGLGAGIMETPRDKVVTYLVVIIVVTIVLMFAISLVLGAIFAVGVGISAI
jgi:hypothetical protein